MEHATIEHRIAPDINNPQWHYVRSEQTNIKERFESFGFKYRDKLYSKQLDFTGLNYWLWLVTHREGN